MSGSAPQQRWQRIKQLVADAVALTPAERERFLADACRNDESLLRDVAALLAAHDDAGDFFELPVLSDVRASLMIRAADLAPGDRLSHYEIIEEIGAGGMGVVYKARDTRLHRTVAIKLLTAHVLTHREALDRFHREARAIAALNHPHICTLYDIGEAPRSESATAEPNRFLVMELVDGPTLADRIAFGPLPIAEVVLIARQIAEALEAAHEQGIIHRDLKPANIKLKSDGTVKVLDFGLAKPQTRETYPGDDALDSPTITSPAMTAAGVILGTAAYMSPEQAKGRIVDKRSDVWAFGCVLYEMLTGRRAFRGDDVADTIASVLRDEPDWTALPPAVPAAIRLIVRRCLEKDPRRRIADLSTIRFVVDEPAISSFVGGAVAAPDASQSKSWRRGTPIVIAIIVAAIAIIAALWTWRGGSATAPAVARFPLAIGEDQAFASNGVPLVAISRDGANIAYAALSAGDQVTVPTQRLFLRSMSRDTVQALASQARGVIGAPVFSPDGRAIAFFVGPPGNVLGQEKGALKRIDADGTGLVTLAEVELPLGLSWSGDSILLGQPSRGIVRVPASGGAAELLAVAKNDETFQGPQLLPGGHALLFTVAHGRLSSLALNDDVWDHADVVVQSLQSGERKTLIEGGSDARYLSSGHLIYAVAGTLRAVAFDPERLELKGNPVPVLEGVGRSRLGPRNRTGSAHFSISDTGALVYLSGPIAPSSSQRHLAFFDRRNGSIETLQLPAAMYEYLRISRDGSHLAIAINDGKQADIWVYDFSGATAMRQLTSGGRNRFPVWSPDGQYIAFQSDRDGDHAIFRQRVDGSAAAERLTKPDRNASHIPDAFSPASDALLFDVETGSTFALWVLTLRDHSVKPIPEVQSASIAPAAALSPDGRWLAYQAGEVSGRRIVVQPMRTASVRLPIANGRYPSWSPDGKQLLYHSSSQMFAVTLEMTPTFSLGNPNMALPPLGETAMRLDTGTESPAAARRNYDLTADGSRILAMVDDAPISTAAARRVEVVLNWLEELKAKIATR